MLLDTCSLLWLVGTEDKLSEKARENIRLNADALYISSISFWEIGIKVNKNLLGLPSKLDVWYKNALQFHHLTELPVNGMIALKATQLPQIHRDPADRIIVATAMQHNLKIITPDKHIAAYPNIKCIF